MISTTQNDCLRHIAVVAASNEAWVQYAAYCTDRERGLRHSAFQQLERFLETSQSWSFHERKTFVDWLCLRLTEFGSSAAYGLIPQPLMTRLIAPTLHEWADAEPADATPCRWLGLYLAGAVYSGIRAGLVESPGDAFSYLRSALARDPEDQLARVRIIEMLLGNAEFSCHHLPDYYIGDPADDAISLGEAEKHLAHIRDSAERARLQSELQAVSCLIADWVSFTVAGESDFAQWCAERGRTYHWVRTYYYTPKGTEKSGEPAPE